ncbi:MAG: GNAT family N-acetyltransferase [Candidatus Hydrogenedentes bacterium]|nr:GNAT family N-acetyltransferase [Candidatus Hydrogenedentota bacterium]
MRDPLTTFIRRADRDDLDIIVGWVEDPDFARFLYGDPARSPRQVREQIVSMLGRTASHTMPGGIYLVIDSKEQGPIGLLSLQHISWRNRCCSVDFYIGRKEFRSGLVAGMAAYRTLEYCFDELNLHRVQAYIYAFNRASWRLLEKTGAVRELTLREHVARDGALHDVYGYGLLRREFEVFRERTGRVRGVSLQDMIRNLLGESSVESGAEGGAG